MKPRAIIKTGTEFSKNNNYCVTNAKSELIRRFGKKRVVKRKLRSKSKT